MNNAYRDIIDKIEEIPTFWDEHAVPRYCEFTPHETANIYASECCLLLIQCQDCSFEYQVCISQSTMDRFNPFEKDKLLPTLSEVVKQGKIHYGDPPNACPENCVAGATMNSVPVRVLEFWKRPGMGIKEEDQESKPFSWEDIEWQRVPELEKDVWPDWMPREEG